VDGTGAVTGRADGAVIITGTLATGETASYTLTVGTPGPTRPAYTLYYAEGDLTMGADTDDATHTTATAHTVDLTIPVSDTELHFLAEAAVTADKWVLTHEAAPSYAGAAPSLDLAAGGTGTDCGLTVPQGYEGVISLVVDGTYTITIRVMP
jgi:hypothetical protein